MPPIRPKAHRSWVGKPAGRSAREARSLRKAKMTPRRIMSPVRSNRNAAAGLFLSNRDQARDRSGSQMEAKRPTIPQTKRKTKGKKIKPWIIQRFAERRYSRRCKNTSKNTALITEKSLPENIALAALENKIDALAVFSLNNDPENQIKTVMIKPIRKITNAETVVKSPTERVAA